MSHWHGHRGADPPGGKPWFVTILECRIHMVSRPGGRAPLSGHRSELVQLTSLDVEVIFADVGFGSCRPLPVNPGRGLVHLGRDVGEYLSISTG